MKVLSKYLFFSDQIPVPILVTYNQKFDMAISNPLDLPIMTPIISEIL